jgi:hypothetical protein
MEIIRLPGYTEHEKYNIAKNFLIPKQIENNGLGDRDIQFSKNAVYAHHPPLYPGSRGAEPGAGNRRHLPENRPGDPQVR